MIHANFCGYCRAMLPEFKAASPSVPNIRFLEIDAGKAEKLSKRFSIEAFPVLALCKPGGPCKTVVGARNEEQIIQFVNES